MTSKCHEGEAIWSSGCHEGETICYSHTTKLIAFEQSRQLFKKKGEIK